MSSDMLALMKRFRVAYAKADAAALKAVTTDDFEWHQHFALGPEDQPTGHVVQGIDQLLEVLQWRAQHWSDVSYAELEERAAGDDLLVQTFLISGKENNRPFSARAVDLYPVRDGKIARKDTYWKYQPDISS